MERSTSGKTGEHSVSVIKRLNVPIMPMNNLKTNNIFTFNLKRKKNKILNLKINQ